MITWKPENVATVDTWMLAMVLSKGYERILIGTDYEIKEVLSKKKTVQLFYDKIRPFGTFLIEFDDDRLNGKWRNALLCLKEAQRVSTLEEVLHILDPKSPVVQLEEKAQVILQEKFNTGDPVCQYVAIRIWNGYWRIRESSDPYKKDAYFECMENLVRPFYREEIILKEDRRILPEDPIFRWPAVKEPCDNRMVICNERLKGTDNYILADDSLIPLKLYYTDSLTKWHLCIIQCKICGKFFLGKSLHCKYCGESCRKVAELINREKRMDKESNKIVEKLCRNEYAYWDNRIRKARRSTVWTEDELYDMESAFIKFKDQKVMMRKKYKAEEITFQELHSWFLAQRDIIDAIMKQHR